MKFSLSSYVQTKAKKLNRGNKPFRTSCLWALVDYDDAKMVNGYFENWAIPLKGQEEERLRLRYEGVKAWDNKNYKNRTFESVTGNKHSTYVLRRTLERSEDFYFLGRLDIHSDIIIKFLRERQESVDLLAEPDKFKAFLRGREIGMPFALSRLSFLNPHWTTQEPFDNLTTLVEIPEDRKLADCEEFWEVFHKNEYRAILIKGAKSIGKTTGVKLYLDKQLQTTPILCLTHRQSLAENLAENLKITNYKNLNTFDNPKAIRMSLCINSLIKLSPFIDLGKYNNAIVILDEIMSLLPAISYRGEQIGMNKIRDRIMKVLKKLFKVADKIIIIDADLDAFVAEFCLKVFGEPATHIIHAYRPLPYFKPVKVISHNDKHCLGQYVNLMLNDPKAYPAIMFLASVNGTREAKKLYEELHPNFNVEDYELEIPEGMHPEVLMLNSSTGKYPKSKEFFQDPKGYVERMKPRLIVATNIVDAGLSIDVFDYFKTVVIATTFNHISPLTMAQQAPRLRDFEAARIFFIPQNIIRKDLDLETQKELTVEAQQIKWLNENLESEEVRAKLHDALKDRVEFIKFQKFLGLKDVKTTENLWLSLYEAKEILLGGETPECQSSPYLDLLFDAIAFDRKMKNNFSEVVKESLLLDDNDLEYDTFTYLPTNEDDYYPSFSQEKIEQIINRDHKDKKEIYLNGDDIDKLIYDIDKEFGFNAHTLPELLKIYQNPKKLSPYKKQVKLAQNLFWLDKITRMSNNPYVPDWEDYEHKAHTLELAEFKIFEQELINGAVSRGKVSQVLNNFKEDEKLKKQALKQFFGSNKKDIAKNGDVIEILKRAFGIKFKRRKSGYHQISDTNSLSYKLLFGILKYKEHIR